jgi:hypothetical protein
MLGPRVGSRVGNVLARRIGSGSANRVARRGGEEHAYGPNVAGGDPRRGCRTGRRIRWQSAIAVVATRAVLVSSVIKRRASGGGSMQQSRHFVLGKRRLCRE